MDAKQFLATIIAPTFHQLLPGRFDSPEARLLLIAISKQEADLRFRQQQGGPARGLWQFEQAGGVRAVLNHHASRLQMRLACSHRGVAPTESDLYRALANDDMLACAAARLLLWTDPKPLPAIGDEQGAFDYYLRNWRPGAYKRDPDGVRERWHGSYKAAMESLT